MNGLGCVRLSREKVERREAVVNVEVTKNSHKGENFQLLQVRRTQPVCE